MKRTPLARKTPLRPTGWISRLSRIARAAQIRNGMDALTRLQMHDLARAVVMVRAGAHYEVKPDRLSWFGKCEDCPKVGALDWSHLLGRGEAPRLVWVPENAAAQNRGCHYRWTNQPSFRADMLERILTARVPCDFALTWDDYRQRLHVLARAKGKADHAAQRLANESWLRARSPIVLADLAEVWQRRADRRIRRRSTP